MASSKSKSTVPSILAKNLHQSHSSHVTFCSSIISSPSSAKSSSMPSFSSLNQIILHRRYVSASPAVQFSIDHHRNDSPARSVRSPSPKETNQSCNDNNRNKKTCMCSPTTHPGSFRCSLHRKQSNTNDYYSNSAGRDATYLSHRLYTRRSAMTNSLVRIGTVEGDLVKRALATLIRPSSHQQRRRGEFRPRQSRLSVMSKAED